MRDPRTSCSSTTVRHTIHWLRGTLRGTAVEFTAFLPLAGSSRAHSAGIRMALSSFFFSTFAALPALAQAPASGDTTRRDNELPIKPERTISFETSEGTYMNLDVSPDGRTIVFDLLGDIYTIPMEGGRATRLTSGMPYDYHPVFSPDGQRIAFVSDASGSDNLWSIAADGSDRKAITRDRERAVAGVEWAPDGDYLLTRRGGLWLFHKEGGSGVQVTRDPQANGAMGPMFSPDGRFIYFSARAGNPFGHTQDLSGITGWQIRRLDRLTGDVAQITAVPYGAFRPRISADGRWLVYGMRMDAVTGLRIRNLDTDEDDWLAQRVDRDNAERAGTLDLMPRYDFTPDGSAIVIAHGGTFHTIDLATKRDSPIHFTALVEQQLGAFVYFEEKLNDDAVKLRNVRYTSTSPDGSQLAFSALSRVWLMDASGGQARPLADQPAGQFQPVFSPDGRTLAWVTWNDTVGGHIWRMPVSGGTPQRVTRHAGFYIHPAWSPDGTKLAYIREDPAAFRNVWSRNTGRIFWIDLNAMPAPGQNASAEPPEPNYVTSAPSDNRLTFATTNDRITYVSDVGAAAGGGGGEGGPSLRSTLSSVRLDGTDKRTIANVTAEAYEIVPSPDNRFLAFIVREDLYLAALPFSAEPPSIGDRSGPGPVKRITREGGLDVHWENDSETLAWNFANVAYRVNAQEALLSGPPAPERDSARGAAADSTLPAVATVTPDSVVIDITVPRDKPEGTVVLRGGNVITMQGDQVIPNATIIVTDNRITWVGPSADASIPQGARLVDITGQTVMPGIVDVHAHLRPPRDVYVQAAWPYLANLAFGVTTTRDVSSSNDGFAYHELVESGEVLGPRIYSTGRAMLPGNVRVDNLEDARAAVRHYKRQGTNVIKQYTQPHRRQRQWLLQAAREERINVTNEGAGDLRLDLTMVLDGFTGFEHALPVADLYNDVIQLIAQSRTWYTPTLVVAYGGPTAEWYFYQTTNVHDDERLNRFTPHEIVDRRTRRGEWTHPDEFHFQAVSRGAANVLKAGGNIGLGAHGEEQGICAHWELWGLQMGGLSNHEALRVATIGGAEALGFQQDLGTIEGGKLADLLILERNPLDDIRNSTSIRMVMRNGELFEAETLRQIWPEQKAPPVYTSYDWQRTGGN